MLKIQAQLEASQALLAEFLELALAILAASLLPEAQPALTLQSLPLGKGRMGAATACETYGPQASQRVASLESRKLPDPRR